MDPRLNQECELTENDKKEGGESQSDVGGIFIDFRHLSIRQLTRFKTFASKEIPAISPPRRRQENKHQGPRSGQSRDPSAFFGGGHHRDSRRPGPTAGTLPMHRIEMARSKAANVAGSCSAPVSTGGAGAMVRAGGDGEPGFAA